MSDSNRSTLLVLNWLEEFTRGDLHLYNIRHVQHHTGALSAYLRRLNINLKWGHTGWPSP